MVRIVHRFILGTFWLALAACGPLPFAQRLSEDSTEFKLAADALASWPAVPRGGDALQRGFTIVLHAGAFDGEGSGTMEFYGPRDFRMVARGTGGATLLDASRNWAGVHVFEHAPALDPAVVEQMVTDLSRALDPPPNLEGLAAGRDQMILKISRGYWRDDLWLFDRATGRLHQADLAVGSSDDLYVAYGGYNDAGWPAQITLRRPSRRYDLTLTFSP